MVYTVFPLWHYECCASANNRTRMRTVTRSKTTKELSFVYNTRVSSLLVGMFMSAFKLVQSSFNIVVLNNTNNSNNGINIDYKHKHKHELH